VLEAIPIVKLVIWSIVTTKFITTYTNCGKIGHIIETCHNRKREVPVVPTATVKFIKPIVGSKP
jgi:hypothetical protein